MENLIEECYQKSIDLLETNSTPYGFSAALAKKKATLKLFHYDWVFGRDASICALGAIASGNKNLLKTAKKSLITLGDYQSENGQIPAAVDAGKKEAEFYYVSSVDGTLWWLIALYYYDKYGGDKKLKEKLRRKIEKAISWLKAQTSGNTNLIEQSQAGDWADLMPRSGVVLYSNVLWYWVQKLYKLPGEKLTLSGLNSLFYPFDNSAGSLFYKKNFLFKRLRVYILKKIKPTSFYLSHVDTFSVGEHCDVYSNLLVIILDLPGPALKSKIKRYLLDKKINKIHPVQVATPPIIKDDREYNEVMERSDLNRPFCYHNGGIWPFVGGFWVIALAKAGEISLAQNELLRLAEANQINDWEFNEWFHGKTGKPMGMPGQSWNAGTFILAYHFLKKDFKF